MAVPTRGLTKSVIVRPGQYIRGRDRGSTRIVARETAPLCAHPHQPDQPLQVLLRIELEANRTLGAAALDQDPRAEPLPQPRLHRRQIGIRRARLRRSLTDGCFGAAAAPRHLLRLAYAGPSLEDLIQHPLALIGGRGEECSRMSLGNLS